VRPEPADGCSLVKNDENARNGRLTAGQAEIGERAMAEVAGRRMTIEIEGDFVVFLIGAGFKMLPVSESSSARRRLQTGVGA
jgi:hypothetical protein